MPETGRRQKKTPSNGGVLIDPVTRKAFACEEPQSPCGDFFAFASWLRQVIMSSGLPVGNPTVKGRVMRGLNDFASQRYLSLETFRRSGDGVRTPVWFAAAPYPDGGIHLYVYSGADAGKTKRIKRSAAVRIAPCTARGTITGAWVEARASIVTDDEFDRGMQLLNRKYWPWKSMLDLLSRLRATTRVMIEIRAA
jgi:PPOX class probable F420-dependent enzyme